MGVKQAKKQTSATTKKMVTFSIETDAEKVMLAGDFTGWDAEAQPMEKDAQGRWKKTIKLNPGRHEYKFLVDGQWVLDPQNHEICQNSLGSQNNVKVV